jgi:uncharacterized protein (TIGR03435 family)
MLRCAILFLVIVPLIGAQDFEVASVRRASPLATRTVNPQGGPGSNDPTHMIASNVTLTSLVAYAFDVKTYRIDRPDWMDDLRYDFAVVVSDSASKEEVKIMWRNLLAERLGMRWHVDRKEFPVEMLVVSPRGHRLHEAAPAGVPYSMGKDLPTLRDPTFRSQTRNAGGNRERTMMGRAQTMARLASGLESAQGHPVVDKTGLLGKYDFAFSYFPLLGSIGDARPAVSRNGTNVADPGIELGQALEQQLGLRLEMGKNLLDHVVIERAEKVPTEN